MCFLTNKSSHRHRPLLNREWTPETHPIRGWVIIASGWGHVRPIISLRTEITRAFSLIGSVETLLFYLIFMFLQTCVRYFCFSIAKQLWEMTSRNFPVQFAPVFAPWPRCVFRVLDPGFPQQCQQKWFCGLALYLDSVVDCGTFTGAFVAGLLLFGMQGLEFGVLFLSQGSWFEIIIILHIHIINYRIFLSKLEEIEWKWSIK